MIAEMFMMMHSKLLHHTLFDGINILWSEKLLLLFFKDVHKWIFLFNKENQMSNTEAWSQRHDHKMNNTTKWIPFQDQHTGQSCFKHAAIHVVNSVFYK